MHKQITAIISSDYGIPTQTKLHALYFAML